MDEKRFQGNSSQALPNSTEFPVEMAFGFSVASETSESSSPFPVIFLICTDMLESIELPDLVPRLRIDICSVTHDLH